MALPPRAVVPEWVVAAGAAAGWADMVPPRQWVSGRGPRSPRVRSLTPVKSPGSDRSRSDPVGTVLAVLAGRDSERAAIAALLEAARRGRGGALVVRGVAGSGKSTLLTEALGDRRGHARCCARRGSSRSPRWPSPPCSGCCGRCAAASTAFRRRRRTALRAAMGEAEGDGDRFLAFLGTLSLLADAADAAPVLVVVDDAHWLDDASAAALLFAARRLQAEPVALLFAARDGDARRFDADGLPAVVLGGVGGADADALLTARRGTAVDPGVRDRLVAGTGGNPLALVELAGVLTAEQLAGRAPLPDPLPLTGGVERAFGDRYRRLAEDAQRFLLVAAADDTGRLTVVRAAAERLGAGEARPRRGGAVRAAARGRRRAHPVPPAGPLGGVPGGDQRAAAGRAPRAGRRAGRRPRPAGVAPGRRRRPARRAPSSPPWTPSPSARPAGAATRRRPRRGPAPPS